MAIEESKVITRYIADTSQERAAIDELIRKTNQLKQAKTASAQLDEIHFDRLVSDLARANSGIEDSIVTWDGLQKKTSVFSRTLGGISSGIGKLSGAMTPLNQGLELANKVIGFASESLDAYAKTSAKAAIEVDKLKKEFEGYRTAVMAGAGMIALELLKPAASFDEIRKSMIRTQNTDLYKRLFLGKGQEFGSFFAGSNEANNPLLALSSALGEVRTAAGKAFARDAWDTTTAQDMLGKLKDKMDATKKAHEEWLKTRGVADVLPGLGTFTRTGGNVERARMSTDEQIRAALGFSPSSGLGEAALANARGIEIDEQKLLEQVTKGPLSRFNEQTSRDSRFAESQGRRTQSYLEQTLGPIDEFNLYAEAFNMLGGAVTASLNAWIDGSMSAGEAIKKFLADALKGLASQMAIEALKHGAYALGSLAFGDVRGAGLHAATAAAFGGGAALAAVAARELGGGGSSVTAGGTGAGAGAVSTGSGGGSGGSREGQSTNHYTIVVGEHFYSESNRMRQLDARRFVEEAVGNSFVEHS